MRTVSTIDREHLVEAWLGIQGNCCGRVPVPPEWQGGLLCRIATSDGATAHLLAQLDSVLKKGLATRAAKKAFAQMLSQISS